MAQQRATIKEAIPEILTDSGKLVLMQEWHCARCGHFIGRHAIEKGVIQVKCKWCKEWNTLDISPEN